MKKDVHWFWAKLLPIVIVGAIGGVTAAIFGVIPSAESVKMKSVFSTERTPFNAVIYGLYAAIMVLLPLQLWWLQRFRSPLVTFGIVIGVGVWLAQWGAIFFLLDKILTSGAVVLINNSAPEWDNYRMLVIAGTVCSFVLSVPIGLIGAYVRRMTIAANTASIAGTTNTANIAASNSTEVEEATAMVGNTGETPSPSIVQPNATFDSTLASQSNTQPNVQSDSQSSVRRLRNWNRLCI